VSDKRAFWFGAKPALPKRPSEPQSGVHLRSQKWGEDAQLQVLGVFEWEDSVMRLSRKKVSQGFQNQHRSAEREQREPPTIQFYAFR